MSFVHRFAFSLFFLAGLFVVANASRDLFEQLGSEHWRTTTGTVLGSKIVQDVERVGGGSYYDTLDGKTRREGDRLHRARDVEVVVVHVTYRYEIKGKEYRDTQDVFGYDDVSDAQRSRAEEYSAGAPVSVLYKPGDPTENSLQGSRFEHIIGSLVFILMGIVFASILPVGEYLAYRFKQADADEGNDE